MKKTLAYVVTAILTGTVVMLFPVLMLYPSQVSTMRGLAPLPASPPPAPERDTEYVEKAPEALEDTQKAAAEPVPQTPPAPETYAEDVQKVAEVEAVAPFPLSLAYAGFIFMLSFVVGLGVSQLYKRKIA